jgi:shikimate kinase
VLDNDELLEAATGSTAKELENEHGREYLHRFELDVIRSALDRPAPVVITAAASVADRDVADEVLAPATVVWLRTRVDTLVERVSGDRADHDDHRPERGDLRTLLTGHAERRNPRYAALADVVVDTDDATPAEVADGILAALGERDTPASDN